MAYRMNIPGTISTLDDLRSWLEGELQAIEQELAATNLLHLNPVFRAPDKIRDGMLVYADGVHFDPGAGAGTYERRGGAWIKL